MCEDIYKAVAEALSKGNVIMTRHGILGREDVNNLCMGEQLSYKEAVDRLAREAAQ